MSRRTAHTLLQAAFALLALVAYVLALLPSDPHVFSNDKANHALAVATLAIVARLGWSRESTLVIGTGLILFGITIELSQALPFIGRDASVADVYADALATVVGLAIGVVTLRLIRTLRP